MKILCPRIWRTFAPCTFLLFLALPVSGEAVNLKRQLKVHQLPRLNTTIAIDAVLDEPIWQQALKVELNYETDPGENTRPPVKTEVFLFENGETLYVGFNALDDNPQAIKDYLTDRDNLWESDFVGVKFDTFGESRKAFQFFVNALGVQGDATQEDFRGDNSNWDAIWDSAGQVTETGYVVEMAIPFKSMRFPETQGAQQWGVELLRFYSRDLRHRIANTPVDRDIACRVCQFDKLEGFANLKPSKNLQLTPTLVMGQSETRDAIENLGDSFAPWDDTGLDNEVGLDFRWGVTQDIILNATINPDFSQVEADAPQLDINNPFTIFLPEKRPFFLSGQDYFNTQRRLVHTRNIEAPEYGVKVTGQNDGHSFGAILVNDDETSLLIPGRLESSIYEFENQKSDNAVLRYSYDLGNKNNVGVLVTDRQGGDYNNQVISFDGKYWFDQYHSFSVQYMTSDTENPQEIIDEFSDPDDPEAYAEFSLAPKMSGDAMVAEFNHNSRNWWGYFEYFDFDKDFRADMGFVSKVNFETVVVGLGHRWFPESNDSWWTRISLSGDWDKHKDNNGTLLEEEAEINFNIQGRLQSNLRAGTGVRERFWNGEYFDENFTYVNAQFQPLSGLKLETGVDWGDKVDFANTRLGEEVTFGQEIEWQISRHWFTEFEYTHVDFEVPAGDLFTARLSNFRLIYQFDIRSFLRFTMQRTDISRVVDNYIDDDNDPTTPVVDATYKSLSNQLLYSYKINPQTLFFAGYADNGYQDDNIGQIEQTGRSIFMKFSYAWQL